MRTTELKIYTFDELSEEAQEKAIQQFSDINTDYEWYESTFMDAERIGLKITGFDIDRNKHCTGSFNLSGLEVAQNILDEHGNTCDTYKLAETFLEEHAPLYADYLDESSENYESSHIEEELLQLEEIFLKDMLEEYASILEREYEYLSSEESIKETIQANEYEFLESGKQYY